MDILKKGQSISVEGYKVYACTPEIMNEGVLDLQFFTSAVQTKQSYIDPDFMDDAYLYYVPDSGSSFLLNFHPVHFDKEAKGNYSHRPGNFVNQAFAGDFSGFYPFELFKNNNTWNAQAKGEAYYYEQAPSALPSRRDINNQQSLYTYEKIAAFIADGRKEALAKAVSFLISQYIVDPENRKYLVIRDESSEKIELWIAAIECAFSPKIAASIPFASRMDKFINTNRYTVNQHGMFHTQMNLQDPNQKQRFRAMIVGVDERDKSNANATRPLASSPFVLLEGKEKKALFDADTSDRYYQLITTFNEDHRQFCRIFLQMFKIYLPKVDIYDLYKLFSELGGIHKRNAREITAILDRLEKNIPAYTSNFKDIHNSIEKELPRFLQEDLTSAFKIINWLEKISKTINDSESKQRISGIICKTFLDFIYNKSNSARTLEFWNQIRTSEFAKDVAVAITDIPTLKANLPNLKSSDMATFMQIYIEYEKNGQNIMEIIKYAAKKCFAVKDEISMRNVVAAMHPLGKNISNILLSLCTEDIGFAEFIIENMLNIDESVISSNDSMKEFCNQLREKKLDKCLNVVLKRRFVKIQPSELEYEQFFKMVEMFADIKDIAYSGLYIMCYRKHNEILSTKIISALSRVIKTNLSDFLLSLCNPNDLGFAEFIVEEILKHDRQAIESDDAMKIFFVKLQSKNLEKTMFVVLKKRILKIYLTDFERFIKTINEMSGIDKNDLVMIYELIDEKITINGINDSKTLALAELLQKNAATANCKNSVHICAMSIIKQKRENFIDELEKYVKKGFPAIQNKDFSNALIDCLLSTKFSKKEQEYIVRMLENAHEDYYRKYVYKLFANQVEQREKLNALISSASKIEKQNIDDMLVQTMIETKQTKETLNELYLCFNDTSTAAYFNDLMDKALESIDSEKSFFSRLGGLFKRKNKKTDQEEKT
jgi:hypothetical protein